MIENERWYAEYERLCDFAYEDWHNYFTEDEARLVAQAWANDQTPAVNAWAHGEAATAVALEEATEILDDLRSGAENTWYHAGEPWSQVAGMERVVMYLRSLF